MGIGDPWLGRSLKEGAGKHFESTDMLQMFPEVNRQIGTEVEEAFFFPEWMVSTGKLESHFIFARELVHS